MILRRRLRNEVGDLVTVHRPFNPLLAWGLLGVISSPFAILAALGPPGPLVGLALFFGFLLPLSYMFGEWILLQHRIYEHALVFRSIPGLRTYVVPFYTVAPDRVVVTERHRVPRGEFQLARRQHRECPVVESSIGLVGLHPKLANRLAKGKLAWHEAGSRTVTHDRLTEGGDGATVVAWQASFRHPERYCQLLRDAVTASHRVRPYHQT